MKDYRMYFDSKFWTLELLEIHVNYYRQFYKNVEFTEFSKDGFFFVAYN